MAADAFEEGVEDGEDFDVAVVVHCGFAVCLEVEGVDHVDVVEVGCGGFVGDIYRVFERQTPDGEGFEFCISGVDAAFVFVVELAETYGHFAATGTWSCDDDERTGCVYVFVASKSFVRCDEVDIGGVSVDDVVDICRNAEPGEFGAECVGAALSVVMGDDYRADEKSTLLEFFAQTDHVHVVCDAEVVAHFVFLDVDSAYDNHNLGLVGEF